MRELKNLVERLLILTPGDVIDRRDVLAASGAREAALPESLFALKALRDFRDEAERLFILHKLERNDWNVTQTAQAIDTPRSNLYKKMEQYGIRRAGSAAPERPEDAGEEAEEPDGGEDEG